MDIIEARKNVIAKQVRPWGGLDSIANDVLINVPREFFVPKKYKKFAFADIEIPLNNKAKMFFPKIEGRILCVLDIKKHETVLEIGTGSGYLTAVLSKLCKHITSVDCEASLIIGAREKLSALNIDNVKLEVKDVTIDWEDAGASDTFFDVIILGGAIPKISKNYMHMLNIGGRVFFIEGASNSSVMTAKLITRKAKDKWEHKSLFETRLDVMQGFETEAVFEF